jgi:hypothetical protein
MLKIKESQRVLVDNPRHQLAELMVKIIYWENHKPSNLSDVEYKTILEELWNKKRLIQAQLDN